MRLETQIRLDLRRMDNDPKAFSRLIGIKREVIALKDARFVADQPAYREIAEMVKDIPEGLECFCCGFRNLRNFQRRDGHIIGPECIRHALGECSSEYSTIVFEDLKIKNMVKNHNLASAIMDSMWGKLCQLTAYEAERRGGRVILVNPSGTSQKCSGCGEMVPKGLEERTHSCPNCNLVLDRDVNAARNILAAGLEQPRVEEQPLLVPRRRISKFAPVKQEAYGFSRRWFT